MSYGDPVSWWTIVLGLVVAYVLFLGVLLYAGQELARRRGRR